MTKLKVHPIDPKAPGSFLPHRALVKASRKMAEAKTAGDSEASVVALDSVYDIVVERLYVDDDSTTVEAEIARMSVEDFQPLIAQLSQESEPVPTTSSKP